MAKKLPVRKRSEAERAAEHCLIQVFDCVITRRAVRAQWQQVDFFASDVVGKRQDGSTVYAQVTAGQSEAVRTRRRKLEVVPWCHTDTVLLLQLVQTDDPANMRKRVYWFRVHRYDHKENAWSVDDEAIHVPKRWFFALKRKDDAA